MPDFITRRIGLKKLVELSRRLAVSHEAGIDLRRTWEREARNAAWRERHAYETVREGVMRGDALHESLQRTGSFFPRLFREMIEVGEKTGSLAQVFRHLADHYEHRLRTRRTFLHSITGPLLQLTAALTVVGLLIWIMGLLAQRSSGEPIDLLGFGLVGTPGLAIYLTILGVLFGAAFVLLLGISRGLAWTWPVQHAALQIPVVGKCLETISLARMAWTLHLTMNVEMDLRHVLPLALRSTGNHYYSRLSDEVVAGVLSGAEIHESLRRTGCFPEDFLETLEVGELSGQVVESMGRLSEQYDERARAAIGTLSTIAGFGVWALVATLIVVLIFRLASFYLGTLNDALNMR